VGFLYTRLWYLLIPAGVMFLIGAFLLLGATDFSARIVSILIAAGLIGGGALLLLRGGRSAGKPKNE